MTKIDEEQRQNPPLLLWWFLLLVLFVAGKFWRRNQEFQACLKWHQNNLVIGFTGKGKCGEGGKGEGKIYLYHTLGKGEGKGKGSSPTIWQSWQRWQRWIFTGADRHGAANHMVGIHLAVIMATFLDPRWITFQNLSQIDGKKQGCSEIQGFGAEEVGRGWGARGFSTLTFLYHLCQIR